MTVTLYYGSGSPYAWRVWLALEHKGVPYQLKTLSFDAGDLERPEFRALNPRGKVPVLVDDGFALYESAAILEYVAERWPAAPSLFADSAQERALQRRMIQEADHYVAAALQQLIEVTLRTPIEQRTDTAIAAARQTVGAELERWENSIAGDYLTGTLSAADFTLYPHLALVMRLDRRNPGLDAAALFGTKLSAWMARMSALPVTQRTWPPHWK
jgi:glutathione S-transferase